MNRIIKFRAWEPQNTRMIQEPYHFEPTPTSILEHEDTQEWEKMPFRCYEDWQDVDDGVSRPCYIMQFTGLTDKNGMQIYEGDIVMVEYGRGQVVFSAGSFMIQWIDDPEANMEELGYYRKTGHSREDLEVIGNIYENPELLRP